MCHYTIAAVKTLHFSDDCGGELDLEGIDDAELDKVSFEVLYYN